jgi:hypothetical protein
LAPTAHSLSISNCGFRCFASVFCTLCSTLKIKSFGFPGLKKRDDLDGFLYYLVPLSST